MSYDEPEILPSSSHPVCLKSADAGQLDQVKRLKELELENARLQKAVSDLTLDKLILKEAARGTEGPRQRNY